MPSSSPLVRFGPFEFDSTEQTLRRDGVAVALRSRPMAMLRVLVDSAGRVVTKDELLARAWPGVVVEENNLQVQVSVLRKLLGADAIATVQGRGYRFALPVTALTGAAAAAPSMASAPVSHAAMIGREAELAVLLDRLTSHRLVTLAGPGGIGKTRLAHAAADRYSGEAHWVELLALSDPALLSTHLLAIVAPNAHPTDADAAMDALAAALRGGRSLLILDNVEHLVDSVAPLVHRLLERDRALRVLVTSQAPLRIETEQVIRLDGLAVPPSGTASAAARQFGAVALFVARAQAVDHRFRLDDDNVHTVIEVCRRLDGIPLALELAAARLPTLGLSGVAQRLDERFRLLAQGSRNAPSRQQTLLATLDWSYQQLAPREQRVFRALGTLPPTFSLASALAVLTGGSGPDEWELVDAISLLVERSLVTMDGGDPPRYTLMETGRAYALTRLAERREYAVVEQASRWYEVQGDRVAPADAGIAALEHYSHALDLAHLLPEGELRDERELELSLKLGPAMQATIGPTHPRCEQIYRRSVLLARAAGPDARAFKALWGYWQFLTLSGRDQEAAPYADEILSLSGQLDDDGLALEALHASMTTRDLLGHADVVVEQAQQIIAMYDRERHHRLTFAFGGHDPCVCACGQGSVNLWLGGRTTQALAMVDRALTLGASLTHGYSRAVACYYASITLAACGERERFLDVARALVALSDEFGMAMLLTEGRIFLGRARYENGDEGGIDDMRQALGEIEASKDLGFVFVYIALLTDALIDTGEYSEAGRLLARSLRYAELGQGLFLPEIYRLRGELARRRGDESGALEDFDRAARLAARQKAHALELRSALSAAGRGDPDRLDRLRTVIAELPDLAPTSDLLAARATLERYTR